MTGQDNSAEAAQWLHEDRISATVQAALDALTPRSWILYHARDYKLGVLQLLESHNLLRNHAEEAETEKWVKAAREEQRAKLKGYHRLARIAADILPETYGAEVTRISEKVRTEADLDAGDLTNVTVAGWAHGGSGPDAIALAKVRKLARDSYPRKTISRADLLAALGEGDGR